VIATFSAFLSGLPYETTEEEIKEFLGELDIQSMVLPKYQDSGRCKGYSHVRFNSEEDMNKCIAMSGQSIGARYIDIC
jgi:nucleolin